MYFYFMCVCVLCGCINVHHVYVNVSGMCGGQKKASDILEMEL